MQEIVDGLLSYARTDDELVVEPVDSRTVVLATLQALEAQIAGSAVEISVTKLPVVVANRGQLHQLFQNLVSNAVKYRNGDAPRVTISCRSEPGVWHFEVADSGVGISEQDQVRIFDLFGRSRSTAGREGSGIGLAVAKRIVERHGGGIWVTSALGRGSEFHFTLPKQHRRADDPLVAGPRAR
jgi:signal transduction histidine kinase